MSIFLDTADIGEIEKYMSLGIIRGVTTNPSLLAKVGVKGGLSGVKKHILKITSILKDFPVSVCVHSNDAEEMIKQAQEFSSWAKNVNVKIFIHGPNGEIHNLEVMHQLATKYKIKVNATAMMSVQQCFLAAMAGAEYVSLLGGRVSNMGYQAVDEVRKLRQVLDHHQLKAKVIMASTREVINIIDWLEAGSDIVTVAPELLTKMIVHPYSKETVQMFLADAKKLDGKS